MRKRTRRKIWSTNIDAITHAITGAALIDRKNLNAIRIRELSSLEAIIKGHGTVYDWQNLVDMLNLSETMAMDGIGPESIDICHQAHDALYKAAMRHKEIGRVVLDGPGINAIRELIEYADLQQQSITRAEFERYIKKTLNRLKSGSKMVVEIE